MFRPMGGTPLAEGGSTTGTDWQAVAKHIGTRDSTQARVQLSLVHP
jgi:hypothetical protein